MNGAEGSHAEIPEREEYPHAEWPPNPPLGQLPPEALMPKSEDGELLEGAELVQNLYGLLLRRWALRKADVFDASSWIIKDVYRTKKHSVPEEWFLRLLILTLEGKTPQKIASTFGVDLLTDEELEKNGDYIGPTPDLISQHKKTKLTGLAKEIGDYVHKKGSKIQLLAFPEIDPETGKETRTSKQIEEMRKKFKLEHRIQLFNLASDQLPSKDGDGFYKYETAIDAMYRSVIKGESDVSIQNALVDQIGKKYSEGNPGNNIARLRFNLMATAVLDSKWSKKRHRLTKDIAPDIAAKILSGKTYVEIAEQIKEEHGDDMAPALHSMTHRLGNAALTKITEHDIRLLLPPKEGDWSLAVAAFLFYYGKVQHSEAVDAATRIIRRRVHPVSGK